MRQFEILRNDEGMRLDRYLKKILPEAGLSLLYKSIRKKNIVVNKKKVTQEYILQKGDIVSIFFSEETFKKFEGEKKKKKRGHYPKIILETEDVLIMEKPAGILSHGAGGKFERNIVDDMITYLIDKGDYVPRIEKTFTPSICNRLDRNTSGLIIGAKTAVGLREVNRMIREGKLEKYYVTICEGELKKEEKIVSRIGKNEEKNRVFAHEEGKDSVGIYKPLEYQKPYTLVEVNLITGRTHQIRYQLSSIGHPVLGDQKYGKNRGKNPYGVNHQLLHSYKLVFPKIEGSLKELSEKVIVSEPKGELERVWKEISKGK
ncbi:RluA family pseudouridine synthase [Peptoniphilus sp. KCTC 25270]|uniref:RluA family pseudouridine synthase n=1 Tax=Peptoniphilus sp. KCTC 25270 TaxID=2897414 RepID=UPI001E382164|nr:RluA family pseudouridine synthase [Peptoniphilus sp. KCTC 25270]MCD1146513.1 RluA family pseudouridine synthase [Peptoniphilus sp. KCTC 25270]